MPRLIWTRQALADVQRLREFWAKTDSKVATRVVRAIREGVEILAHQPLIGRPADLLEDTYPDRDLRERLIDFGRSGYVLLYRVDGERIVLLSIRHQRETGY